MTDAADRQSEHPPFLDLVDRDPEEAFRQFYLYARAQLHALPPVPARALPAEERRDLLHDVVYHCVRDNFRVLRQFRERGSPFAGWLYVVAHREALAFLRRRGRALLGLNGLPHAHSPDIGRLRLLGRVRGALAELKEYCRKLLMLAADEYTPLEMARVLGRGNEENKKIADQVRECRRQLKARLEREGVDWRSGLERQR